MNDEKVNTIPIAIYKETEKYIYSIIDNSEKKEEWKRNLKNSSIMSKFIEDLDLPALDLPETKPLSHADIIHFAMLTYLLIAQLPEKETISIRAIKETVALMNDLDGVVTLE